TDPPTWPRSDPAFGPSPPPAAGTRSACPGPAAHSPAQPARSRVASRRAAGSSGSGTSGASRLASPRAMWGTKAAPAAPLLRLRCSRERPGPVLQPGLVESVPQVDPAAGADVAALGDVDLDHALQVGPAVRGVVVVLAMQEQDHVTLLLQLAGLAQVREGRAL